MKEEKKEEKRERRELEERELKRGEKERERCLFNESHRKKV